MTKPIKFEVSGFGIFTRENECVAFGICEESSRSSYIATLTHIEESERSQVAAERFENGDLFVAPCFISGAFCNGLPSGQEKPGPNWLLDDPEPAPLEVEQRIPDPSAESFFRVWMIGHGPSFDDGALFRDETYGRTPEEVLKRENQFQMFNEEECFDFAILRESSASADFLNGLPEGVPLSLYLKPKKRPSSPPVAVT